MYGNYGERAKAKGGDKFDKQLRKKVCTKHT